jgi:hypothetical protein
LAEDTLRLGDRVQFTVGEGKLSYTGYGRVTKTTHGATMIEPDKAFPLGLKILDIKKVAS